MQFNVRRLLDTNLLCSDHELPLHFLCGRLNNGHDVDFQAFAPQTKVLAGGRVFPIWDALLDGQDIDGHRTAEIDYVCENKRDNEPSISMQITGLAADRFRQASSSTAGSHAL